MSQTNDIAATPKISIRDLCFYYGEHKALHEVSMDIQDRKVTALIGPSGCGKSTLLRILNRIYDLYPGHKATGQVLFNNTNILDQRNSLDELRAKVGMVFQKPTPFPMSIYDNIAFPVKLYRQLPRAEMDEVVESSLQRAGLWKEVKDKLRQSGVSLSGGQQQRLCIARAVAIKPEVLLLDEPASALDPISTSHIEDLVQELSKDFCVVIVTHNLQQAARVSDFTAFMYLGKLIEFDATDTIFLRPGNEMTHNYITGRFG